MNIEKAIAQLSAMGDASTAAKMQNIFKVGRPYLGVSNGDIGTLYKQWRTQVDGSARTALAAELWDSNIHEARLVAAKLLTQARINPDDHVWAEITRWIGELDHVVYADAACGAAARRLMAHPDRMAEVADWVEDEDMWVRRSVMTITLPLTKLNNPKVDELARRDQVLSWMGDLASDSEWLVQNAIGHWLATLSKHDAPRMLSFLETYGADLKPFATKEACKFL
jgi:3-methyladenine DNA glycosylase AlkD